MNLKKTLGIETWAVPTLQMGYVNESLYIKNPMSRPRITTPENIDKI